MLTVVGLVEPIDPREEYWLNSPAFFTVPGRSDLLLVPFYVPEMAFFDSLGGKYPGGPW